MTLDLYQLILLIAIPVILVLGFTLGYAIGKKNGYRKRVRETQI